jgi:GDPmannose 4,6-dehydratase
MKSTKRALITGAYGQDGSYLSELLIAKGYEVFGVVKERLSDNSKKIKAILAHNQIFINEVFCDLENILEIENLLKIICPDEIYHLAAKNYSSEQGSDYMELDVYLNNVNSTFNLLRGLYQFLPTAKFVTAGSCLMYDNTSETPQTLNTQCKSKSFYGFAKITEKNIVEFFRTKQLHASTAIFFNHDSPRRSVSYVSRKIVNNFVGIRNNKIETFELGNLDAVKEWGYAKDYAYALWLMAQKKKPDDYMICTGQGYSLRDYINIVCNILSIENGFSHIRKNPDITFRKNNFELIGDFSRTTKLLNWKPSICFNDFVSLMVRAELQL